MDIFKEVLRNSFIFSYCILYARAGISALPIGYSCSLRKSCPFSYLTSPCLRIFSPHSKMHWVRLHVAKIIKDNAKWLDFFLFLYLYIKKNLNRKTYNQVKKWDPNISTPNHTANIQHHFCQQWRCCHSSLWYIRASFKELSEVIWKTSDVADIFCVKVIYWNNCLWVFIAIYFLQCFSDFIF